MKASEMSKELKAQRKGWNAAFMGWAYETEAGWVHATYTAIGNNVFDTRPLTIDEEIGAQSFMAGKPKPETEIAKRVLVTDIMAEPADSADPDNWLAIILAS